MENGIYFGLDETLYHAERRFSFSGAKDIMISPLTYWARHINPARTDDQTKAMEIGEAYHKRILEGDAVFHKRFAVKPTNDGSYTEGGAELKELCGTLGLKKSGTIAEMCARILESDPKAKLWPLVVRKFEDANVGKTLITEKQFSEIELPARAIELHPHASKAFANGYPEVSIFWTDEESGVKCKTRPDYVKLRSVVDLKTFSNPLGFPIGQAVARAVGQGKYHVQARMQLEGLRVAKQFITEGKVSGEVSPDFLKAVMEQERHVYIWVFVQQGDVPEILMRELPQYAMGAQEGATENLIWQSGWDTFRHALGLYKAALEHFGDDPNVPWMTPEPMIPFRDEDFPMWLFN